MEEYTNLNQILLKSLSYTNGKWLGSLELVIQHNENDVVGSVDFMYDRTWHLHAFKYPQGLDDTQRDKVKIAFSEQFKDFSSLLENEFFGVREKFGAKPMIAAFEINDELSGKEAIYAQFALQNIRETFFINIQLLENVWHYKLHTKQQSLDTYKTFYAWEDVVFEKVIEEINKNTQYRLKFVVHAKKFKYK